MKYISIAAAAVLLGSMTALASAQSPSPSAMHDSMHSAMAHTSPKPSHSAMSHDSMHAAMAHPSPSASHSAMSHDAMSHDAMTPASPKP
jgi:hypothetical protein